MICLSRIYSYKDCRLGHIWLHGYEYNYLFEHDVQVRILFCFYWPGYRNGYVRGGFKYVLSEFVYLAIKKYRYRFINLM